MGEIIFLSTLEVIFIYLYTMVDDFPVSILDTSGGAGLFPRVVLLFLLILIPLQIITILFKKNKEKFVFKEIFQGMRLLFLVALILTVGLMPLIGFTISMILFLLVVINWFYYNVHGNIGKIKSVILRCSIVTVYVIALKLFFTVVLNFTFPTGIVGF